MRHAHLHACLGVIWRVVTPRVHRNVLRGVPPCLRRGVSPRIRYVELRGVSPRRNIGRGWGHSICGELRNRDGAGVFHGGVALRKAHNL